MRIGTREALNARREQAKAWLAAEQRVILVCAGTGCISSGSLEIYDELGINVTEDEAETLAEQVRAQFPDCEVELNDGGQPIYYYLLSVE